MPKYLKNKVLNDDVQSNSPSIVSNRLNYVILNLN
ncbi:MAG: hypothetical protein ACI9N3_002372 [Colwellia sp.]|jgi:hypothetical protein